jgi:hypothetical protein
LNPSVSSSTRMHANVPAGTRTSSGPNATNL